MIRLSAAAFLCASLLTPAAMAQQTEEEPAPQQAAEGPGSTATAMMAGPDGAEMGQVTFAETASGQLHVTVEMTGLAPGAHGFHVHENGECDGAGGFESAGGHYAGGHDHGVMTEGGPHAGDFPNVNVGQDGVLKVEFFTDRMSLAEGAETPLIDDNGSAVVVHADPDDYSSQPSGEAGDRIACGVIEQPA